MYTLYSLIGRFAATSYMYLFSIQIQYKVINIFPVVLEFSCTYWIVPPKAILMESRTLSMFSIFFTDRLTRNGQQPSFCSRDFEVCQ